MLPMDEVISADVEDGVTSKEVPSFMAAYHEKRQSVLPAMLSFSLI